jgi:hypothetical protein
MEVWNMARETPLYDRAAQQLDALRDELELRIPDVGKTDDDVAVLAGEAVASSMLAVVEALQHATDDIRAELRGAAYDVREGLRDSVHVVDGYAV